MIRTSVGVFFTVLGILICAHFGGQMLDEPPAHTLEACPTEDSDDCYWDAARGNGGRSFINIGGEITYVP